MEFYKITPVAAGTYKAEQIQITNLQLKIKLAK
jgi:hypothetical protein